MLKRILVSGLLVFSFSSLTSAGEHLEALPGKREALAKKASEDKGGMLGIVVYNLGKIADRVQGANGDSIERTVIIRGLGLNVMMSAFDTYMGINMASVNSYFRRVTQAMQQTIDGSYDVEEFARQLNVLMDALHAGTNVGDAFDAFIEYLVPSGGGVEDNDENEKDADDKDNSDDFSEADDDAFELVLDFSSHNQTQGDSNGFGGDDDAAIPSAYAVPLYPGGGFYSSSTL